MIDEQQTATGELRQLLDDRGVEYETDDTQVSETEWYYVTKLRDGYCDRWTYEEPPECGLLVSYQYDLGAEDAIEATLGRGTCKIERVEDEQRILHGWLECSECGPVYPPVNDRIAQAVAFCPFCGRKVANEQ